MAITAIGVCLALTQAVAQSAGSLSGTIRDAQQQPVSFAVVALHRQADSTLVKTTMPDSLGQFSLTQLGYGTYYAIVKATGFKPWQSPVLTIDSLHPSQELSSIVLSNTVGQLKELQVVSRKAMVEHKPDRTVVNVDAMITAAGTTALDVLSKSPGVQLDPDGNISLKGKQGVMVYINDKPTYLSGTELANYLRSMPSSSLDQVELMPNPPARYDAGGTGGIINIRIKRNTIKGVNGGLNLSVNQGQLTRSNNSANLNYRNNKVSIFANGSYNLNNSFTDLDLNRTYKNADNTPASYFEQKSYFKRNNNAYSINAGADYYFNDRTTFGIVVSGMDQSSGNINDNTSRLLNLQRQVDSVIVAHNDDKLTFKNGTVNLNYRKQFNDKGHELTVDADYLAYRYKTTQAYQNTGYHPDLTMAAQDVLNGYLPSQIDIYSAKTDYTRPLPFDWKLSTGLKYSNTQTDNVGEYSTTADGQTNPDYEKSNHFKYKESIGAAYVNLDRDFGKLSVQGGLRLEHTQSNGHQLGNPQKPDSSFNRNYTNLFPTLYLSYKFDSAAKHQLGLNYGRRIERPYYQDLNPFLFPIDKFTYYNGNPFLRPSFIQSIELSYTYKNRITTAVSYSKSRDNINETIEMSNEIYYSRPGNIGTKNFASVSVDATFDPAKWFNLHVYTALADITTKGPFYGSYLNTSGTFWSISGNARFSPGSGWDIEANAEYSTRIYDAQFTIGPLWVANIAVQKKVTPKLTLKLGFNDIFYSRIVHGTIGNLSQAEASWTNRMDSRNVSFSLSYRFGKAFKTGDRHQGNSATEEKNRVKD